MALARERARDVVGRLPDGGRITVVAAADTANVLVSETDDRAAALEAIDGITATQLPGDLTDAFALASALAARDADSTVVVVTDAAGDELPDVGVGAPRPRRARRLDRCEPGDRRALRPAPRRRRAARPVRRGRQPVGGRGDAPARGLRRRRAGRRARADDPGRPALRGAHQHRARRRHGRRGAAGRIRRAATDDRAFAVVPAEETTRALLVGRRQRVSRERPRAAPPPRAVRGRRRRLRAMHSRRPRRRARRTASSSSTASCRTSRPGLPALYLDPGADGPFGTVEGRIESPAHRPHRSGRAAPALRRSDDRAHRPRPRDRRWPTACAPSSSTPRGRSARRRRRGGRPGASASSASTSASPTCRSRSPSRC